MPANYVIGPGDTFEVQLIGERGGRYTLVVGRDGVVDFPELGPIAVAGLRFEAARTLLEQRVGEQMIGMRASVSMGALRSIQVFVLGEAQQPGSYTVSGLSTITHALFASGGVKPIGSLRNIELKRNGTPGPEAGSLRPAAEWRHQQRLPVAAGGRDFHPSRRHDRGDFG